MDVEFRVQHPDSNEQVIWIYTKLSLEGIPNIPMMGKIFTFTDIQGIQITFTLKYYCKFTKFENKQIIKWL